MSGNFEDIGAGHSAPLAQFEERIQNWSADKGYYGRESFR